MHSFRTPVVQGHVSWIARRPCTCLWTVLAALALLATVRTVSAVPTITYQVNQSLVGYSGALPEPWKGGYDGSGTYDVGISGTLTFSLGLADQQPGNGSLGVFQDASANVLLELMVGTTLVSFSGPLTAIIDTSAPNYQSLISLKIEGNGCYAWFDFPALNFNPSLADDSSANLLSLSNFHGCFGVTGDGWQAYSDIGRPLWGQSVREENAVPDSGPSWTLLLISVPMLLLWGRIRPARTR